jgi:hypothetical protein
MPQNNSTAQSEQLVPKLIIDFSHRLSCFSDEATAANLAESVDGMTTRSLAMLSVLAGNFVGDPSMSVIPDDTIFWFLQSVSNEIRDIQNTVEAYQLASDLAKSQA